MKACHSIGGLQRYDVLIEQELVFIRPVKMHDYHDSVIITHAKIL